ncbi:MAG: adenosylcobinamide-GDP ribazoletransferase [Desulfarculaceae bacterium]|nr:adenosylcobinamide-GDP ribazoletransferase [Desulfarculaceae bacterium]
MATLKNENGPRGKTCAPAASWNDFRSAVQFITILPAGREAGFSASGMIRFFPVVGLVIGILLILVDRCASLFWGPGTAALLDTVFLAAVTGAFHLDGLGDTADGLFSHRSRERALEIMKDSRTGMMGLVAVICILALKTAGIYSVKTTHPPHAVMLFLLIIPAYARTAMLFGFRSLPYGRPSGTGRDFFERPMKAMDFVWFAIPLLLSVFAGAWFVLFNAAFCATVFLVLLFYKKKMGCITGDMLGAMTEITEAVLFLFAGAGIFS